MKTNTKSILLTGVVMAALGGCGADGDHASNVTAQNVTDRDGAERGEATEFVMRRDYGARLEPAGGVLHGAGQDVQSFVEYVDALGAGRHPQLYMTYVSLARQPERVTEWGKRLLLELEGLPGGLIPQVGINFTAGNDDGSGQDERVAAGELDDGIEAFVDALRQLERPVFLRIGYEFEGDWNGYSANSFAAAYTRIAAAVREAGIEAALVWCSGGGSAGFMPMGELMEYYPGDEWVDWWGIDVFSPEELTDARLVTFLEAADEHAKPVMLGEVTPRYVGVEDGNKSWDAWFEPFFRLIAEYPQIKAFCYINWDWLFWSEELGFGWHDWKDARLQLNDAVLDAYRSEMDRSIYCHLD